MFLYPPQLPGDTKYKVSILQLIVPLLYVSRYHRVLLFFCDPAFRKQHWSTTSTFLFLYQLQQNTIRLLCCLQELVSLKLVPIFEIFETSTVGLVYLEYPVKHLYKVQSAQYQVPRQNEIIYIKSQIHYMQDNELAQTIYTRFYRIVIF